LISVLKGDILMEISTNNHIEKLKVLHLSPEVTPLSKAGGLADVAFALPSALVDSGIDARIITCAHPGVLDRARDLGWKVNYTRRKLNVALDWRVISSKLWKTSREGVTVYILENPDLFKYENIYPENFEPDDIFPFIYLSFAALELPELIKWTPHVFHCHDWGTSALPSALEWHPYYRRERTMYKTVTTIHNLAHQGIVNPEIIRSAGLMEGFHIDGLEFYGSANLLKGSINASDAITTVSPSYSREIQEPGQGMGLDGLIRSKRDKIHGILNGIDTNYWDPSKDPLIPVNYSKKDPEGKTICRKEMLECFHWEDNGKPLICNIGRLYSQKGIDILLPAIPKLIREGARFVFLGTGDQHYEKNLLELAEHFPDNIGVKIGFNEPLAHLMYAGSDLFIMPSLFEPCGLSQLISLRYGTIPIVRKTGGLEDTVRNFGRDYEGWGFIFEKYATEDLVHAVLRSIECYRSPECWRKIFESSINLDFSWKRSANEYIKLYNNIVTT